MKEKICRWLLWQLLWKICYFAMIRIAAYATQGQWSTTVIPDLTVMDALPRWERGNENYGTHG